MWVDPFFFSFLLFPGRTGLPFLFPPFFVAFLCGLSPNPFSLSFFLISFFLHVGWAWPSFFSSFSLIQPSSVYPHSRNTLGASDPSALFPLFSLGLGWFSALFYEARPGLLQLVVMRRTRDAQRLPPLSSLLHCFPFFFPATRGLKT